MMTTEQLSEFLRRYTPSEERHLNDPERTLSPRYRNIPKVRFRGREMYQFHYSSLLKNGLICVNKETRFTSIPEHIHTVIEFVYVYSGKCIQSIDGRDVEMNVGDICLLDTNVPHSVGYLEENDIILTIEMRKEFLTQGFLRRLGQNGIITSFLVNSLSEDSEHDQYLLFQGQGEGGDSIRPIIQNILCEYFDPAICSGAAMEAHIMLLYCELLRRYSSQMYRPNAKNQWRIVDILEYIERNYASITLEDTARAFGFHPNYLSAYIRRGTGRTFKELVITQRMYQTCTYLLTTTLPVQEIAGRVGYENLGFFYQKFQSVYGVTPAQYRQTRGRR